MVMNSALYTCYVVPQTVSDNVPTADLGWTASSLEGALLEHPPRNGPCDPLPPPNVPCDPLPPRNGPSNLLPKRGPIYNVPVEILIRIFQLVAPPQIRNSLYDLSKLTHICRFWREVLMNQPRLWSAVFITQRDRRRFVKACLERSHPVTLQVTVEIKELGKFHSDCTCDKKSRQRLLPNDFNPCEWHFQFELLAETKHSNRIRVLDIEFDGDSDWISGTDCPQFVLGSCRFFTLTFPRLVTLTWKNLGTIDSDYLFSTPPFVPTLRSLTYMGVWNSLIKRVTNLTSFSFSLDSDFGPYKVDTEAFRLLMYNNRSLESLVLKWVVLEGDSKGSPVYLLNLKSLTVKNPLKKLSTTIRIPAFQRLSSLRISAGDSGIGDEDEYTLYATGDNITIKTYCSVSNFAERWEDLTGYAKPIIRHIRLYDGPDFVDHSCWRDNSDNSSLVLLMMDAQTLEVGSNYQLTLYRGFWEDLKQLGAQLKTIRFEVSEDVEPCLGDDCAHDECYMWDPIEDLVKYRFDQGRPFSAVERMVVSENDRENRFQAYVWRCSYGFRKLDQYVQPIQI